MDFFSLSVSVLQLKISYADNFFLEIPAPDILIQHYRPLGKVSVQLVGRRARFFFS